MNHNTSAQCHTENGEVFMTDQSGNGHHLKQKTMKKLSETLTKLGIDFTFPIEIKNSNGNLTYYEDIDDCWDNYWQKWEYDANGNQTYYENSDGFWERRESDVNGRPTYHENSNGFWQKWDRDANGNWTYYEDSNGFWSRWERDANGDVNYYEDSTGVKEVTPKSTNQ